MIVPDLAFSELDFLNAPRRAPQPAKRSASPSSFSSEDPPVSKPTKKKKSKGIMAAVEGFKLKHSASKYFENRNRDKIKSPVPSSSTESFKVPLPTRSKLAPIFQQKPQALPILPSISSHSDATSLSGHSAHSLALRQHSKSKVDASIIEEEPAGSVFIDTTSAWKPLNIRASQIAPSITRSIGSAPPLDYHFDPPSTQPQLLSPPPAAQEATTLPTVVHDRHSTTSRIDRLIRACDTGEWDDSTSLEDQSVIEEDQHTTARESRSYDNGDTISSFGNNLGRNTSTSEEMRKRGGSAHLSEFDWEELRATRRLRQVDEVVTGEPTEGDESLYDMYGQRSDGEGQLQLDLSKDAMNDDSGDSWNRREDDEQEESDVDPVWLREQTRGFDRRPSFVGPTVSSSNDTDNSYQPEEYQDIAPARRGDGAGMFAHLTNDQARRGGVFGRKEAESTYSTLAGRQRFSGEADFTSAMRSHWYPSKC
jgi:hypothetical protein